MTAAALAASKPRYSSSEEARAEHQIAGVPQIALLDVGVRGRRVRLLDEFLGGEDALAAGPCRGGYSRTRSRARSGVDAERHDVAALGRGARGAAGGDEARDVGDDVVGGERQHDRRLPASQRMHRAGDDRRRGVAPMRLEQDVGVDTDLGELLGDQEPVLMIGDDDRPSEHRRIADPADRSPERSSADRTAAETAWAALRATPATAASRRRRT